MEDIVKGLSLILEFENIILILGGVLIGVLVGALPGLSSPTVSYTHLTLPTKA